MDLSAAGNASPNVSSASLVDHILPTAVPAPKGATPFDIAMARFLDETGSDGDIVARRHSMFKIIPRVKEGGWIVKQAVGQNTPVLLGKKLTTKYYRYDPTHMALLSTHAASDRLLTWEIRFQGAGWRSAD